MQNKCKFLGLLIDDKMEKKPENTRGEIIVNHKSMAFETSRFKNLHFLGDKWNRVLKQGLKNGLNF